MHGFDLIATLAGGLTAGLVFGYITHRLGLSPIVGYLLGGVLVGPHTPGFVADGALAEQLAEVGVILLMFGVGLQFHLQELLAVRRVAIPGAVGQSVAATVLGRGGRARVRLGLAGGIRVRDRAGCGEHRRAGARAGGPRRPAHADRAHRRRLAGGRRPVHGDRAGDAAGRCSDRTNQEERALLASLALTAVKVVALVLITITVGGRVIPWLLDRAAATRSRELFTLTVLVLALGIAVVSASLFGVSMALGAFLAGMVVGRSDYSLRAASEALPMRDAFAVLFFVSVGMLLDPGFLLSSPGLILATLAVVVIAKPLVAILVVRLLRYPLRVALAVGVALAQIGEFSFILVAMGRDLGVLTPTAMNTVVAVSIISIVLNPMLYRLVTMLEQRAATHPGLWRLLHGSAADPPMVDGETPSTTDSAHRAVVVGYGPTGQTLTRLLRENDIEPTIVELNVDTVRRLRSEGIRAVYGDARHRDTLEAAHVAATGSLILTADLRRERGSDPDRTGAEPEDPDSREDSAPAAAQGVQGCRGRDGVLRRG